MNRILAAEQTLTPTEIAFLTAIGLTAADVFDGRGMSQAGRRAAAKAAGRRVILCSGRCEKGDHRLKWRPGHCAQCNPAGFAYNGAMTRPGSSISPGAHQPAFSRSASRTTSSSAPIRSTTSKPTAASFRMAGISSVLAGGGRRARAERSKLAAKGTDQ